MLWFKPDIDDRGPIPDQLVESYRYCRRLNRRHGSTYFWATELLPRRARPHIHALYALCRYADDIVDGSKPLEVRAASLEAFGERLLQDFDRGSSNHLVRAAVTHTSKCFGIEPDLFQRFLHSMSMDLFVAEYETFDDLLEYMDGSAAVIGEMTLPVLGGRGPGAVDAARSLGIAFQLTNFLRDVGEDLDRGRVYIPQEDVRAFDCRDALERRGVTHEWMELMRFEIARTRDYYEAALPGIAALPPSSARCVGAAWSLYGMILERIEANHYDVFSTRARVSMARKVATGLGLRRRSVHRASASNGRHVAPSAFVTARQTLAVHTGDGPDFVDITPAVIDLVRQSRISFGSVLIHCPHTSAGLVVNEHENGLLEDLQRTLDELVPRDRYFAHDDLTRRWQNLQENEPPNGHSHVRASLVTNPSVVLPIGGGAPMLGRWQRIFLVELDGDRDREVTIVAQGARGAVETVRDAPRIVLQRVDLEDLIANGNGNGNGNGRAHSGRNGFGSIEPGTVLDGADQESLR